MILRILYHTIWRDKHLSFPSSDQIVLVQIIWQIILLLLFFFSTYSKVTEYSADVLYINLISLTQKKIKFSNSEIILSDYWSFLHVTYVAMVLLFNAADKSAIWSADICFKSWKAGSKDEDTARIFEAWECWCYQVDYQGLLFNQGKQDNRCGRENLKQYSNET